MADKTTLIVVDLLLELKESLVTCLTRNVNIFAWLAQEIKEVFPSIMEHKFNIVPEARHVKKKKQHFSPEKDKISRANILKLLEVGHIIEI